MAKRPFFTGDYGSALGRIDTRPIIEAGRAQGQMYANLGAQAAKAIETYQLNKEERAKLTGEIEQDILNYGNSLTQTGNEDIDKKNQLLIEKFQKGNASIPDMRNLAGSLARAQLNEQKQMENDLRDLKTGLLLADEARKKADEARKKAEEARKNKLLGINCKIFEHQRFFN